MCKLSEPDYFFKSSSPFDGFKGSKSTAFIRQLYQDKNKSYYKLIRAKNNWIKPCNCKNREVHAYCFCSKILHDKIINCTKCGCHYKLRVKKETLFNKELTAVLVKYTMLNILLMFASVSFLALDAYLKCEYAKLHPDEVGAHIDELTTTYV